jgi:hypothetical protein
MLTNGHAKIGYKDPESVLPTLPLKPSGRPCEFFNGYGVSDSKGMLMAYFRNREDRNKFMSRFNNGS